MKKNKDMGKLWEMKKGFFDEYKKNYNWLAAAREAVEMNWIYPSRKEELKLDDNEWEELQKLLEYSRVDDDWYTFCLLAAMMKRWLPKEMEKFKISAQDWNDIRKNLDFRCQPDVELNQWEEFLRVAAAVKILCPSKLKISDDAWKRMKKDLAHYREDGSWPYFLRDAADMTILAAHKVEVTEDGLKITMNEPEEFRETREPMPVRKKF